MDHEVPEEDDNAAAAQKAKTWHAIEDFKTESQQLQLAADETTAGNSTDLLGLLGPLASTTSQQREAPARFGPDNEQKWRRTARVCPDCVLKERIKQWPQKSNVWQQKNPDWATPQWGQTRDEGAE